MSNLRADIGVETAPDMHAPVYYGALTDPPSIPWPKNRVRWHCKHKHRTKAEARECATSELRQRQAARREPAGQEAG